MPSMRCCQRDSVKTHKLQGGKFCPLKVLTMPGALDGAAGTGAPMFKATRPYATETYPAPEWRISLQARPGIPRDLLDTTRVPPFSAERLSAVPPADKHGCLCGMQTVQLADKNVADQVDFVPRNGGPRPRLGARATVPARSRVTKVKKLLTLLSAQDSLTAAVRRRT